MKTSELIGPALAWAVTNCEDPEMAKAMADVGCIFEGYNYPTDWSVGGPITDREHIEIRPTITEGGYRTSDSPDAVQARILLPNGATVFDTRAVVSEYGPTTLIAAMRCYVASKLGDEIEIPEELK